MSAIKRSVKVVQVSDFTGPPSEGVRHAYRVKATTNTTTPEIGEELTKEQVNTLIGEGFTVTVTDPS